MRLIVMAAVLWLLLAGSGAEAFGQGLRRKGFVVTNTGDTVQGWVDYRAWRRNPSKIVFRRDSADEAGQGFGVGSLRGFGVEGLDVYERAFVTRDMRPVVGELLPGSVDTTISESVWLRVLVRGKKLDLYEYEDGKAHYFVRKAGGDIMELRYTVNEDNGYHTELKIYEQQLKEIVDGQPGMTETIDKAAYFSEDLQGVVSKINGDSVDWVGRNNIAEPSYEAPKEKRGGPFFFVAAGGGLSRLVEDWHSVYAAHLMFKDQKIPYFAAGMEWRGPRSLRNLMARLEVSYYQISYAGSGQSLTGAYGIFKYEVDQKNITVAASCLYNFIHGRRIEAYAGGSFLYNISSYKGGDYHQDDIGFHDKNYVRVSGGWMAGAARAGVVMGKRWELGGIAQMTGGFGSNPDFGLRVRNYLGFVAIKLGATP